MCCRAAKQVHKRSARYDTDTYLHGGNAGAVRRFVSMYKSTAVRTVVIGHCNRYYFAYIANCHI